MGVNSEKEPLSGTTPERRLFERSLHFKMKKISKNLSLVSQMITLKEQDIILHDR
jgi:hypothetical protein